MPKRRRPIKPQARIRGPRKLALDSAGPVQPIQDPEEIYIGCAAAAAAVRRHTSTIARWVKSGRLPSIGQAKTHTPGSRPYLIARPALLKAAGLPPDRTPTRAQMRRIKQQRQAQPQIKVARS